MKDFVNQLSSLQLKKHINWWGEERGGKVIDVYCLQEDFCQTDYGIEPASVQEYEEGDKPYPITHPKGTPIISVD